MGHTRLGAIPKSQKWTAVVSAFAPQDDEGAIGHAISPTVVESIALHTMDAARGGLERAVQDPGLIYTFFLLTQLALATRTQEWEKRLSRFGIHISPDATIFDITAEIQYAVDDFLAASGHTTDISEIAQKAAGEAIASLAGPQSETLFGGGADDVRIAIRALSTKNGFGKLGQAFFGNFLARFLNFYLSRITAAKVGAGALSSVDDISTFNKALQHHCQQSAYIVRSFAGTWFSKTEFQEGIDLSNTARFIAVAVEKLRSELEQQKAGR